ncbi:MAG: hypothetical protein ABIQ95_04295 [Bdellovibrionia bacterium]
MAEIKCHPVRIVHYVDMIIFSFAKIKYPLAVLILSSSLGCASSPSTDTNSTQDRNPATHSESSGSGRQQEGHYDHQHDEDAPEGLVLGQCQVCFDDVTDQDITNHKAYACSENHCIDTHCLAHQVKSLEIHSLDQVKELQNHGLSCCGEGGKCKERIALDTVKDLLEKADRKALNERLTKIEKSAKLGLDARAEREINALSYGIEGAFNLCCPANGCGATLDKIQGCNAATCSDETCKATFCYLCLKQTGSFLGLTKGTAEYAAEEIKAHDHVRLHSNNYWEERPGFTERYHWQISRKEIAGFFKGKIDPKVRQKALEPHKALLEEKNLWPMPAGMKTEAWIKVVQATPKSSRKYYVYENHGQNQKKVRVEKTEALHTKERKIELLQNEYIYLRQQGDMKNAELVKSALESMGGQVFASLDLRDGAQPVAPVVAANGAILGQAGNANRGGGVRNQPVQQPFAENERLHPVLGAEQVQVFRALGEEQYRVGDLIWSSAAVAHHEEGGEVREMNWDAANRFCRDLGDGARLPTKEEYGALGRAMGRPNNYNPDMIADMRGNWFWSSSVHPGYLHYYYVFYGNDGDIDDARRVNDVGAVRCVRVAGRG